MRITGAARLGLISIGLVACGDKGNTVSSNPSRHPPDDGAIIHRESSWGNGVAWQFCPKPEFVLGVDEGPPELTFSYIGNATQLRNGSIVISDSRQNEIRFFNAEGAHVITVGRKGKGPGEYQALADVVRTSGDTLFVSDFVLNRVTVLDRDGRYVRSLRVTRPVRIAGLINDTLMLIESGFTDPTKDGLTRGKVFLATMTTSDGHARSVGTFPGPEVIRRERLGGSSIRGAPFGRRTHAAAGSRRFFIGTSDRDSIRSYNENGADGAVIGGIRKVATVPPDGALKYYQALYPERSAEQHFRRIGYPDAAPPTMPAFDGLLVDTEGFLWVRRYDPPWVTEPSLWDVHDPDGRFLGAVEMPSKRTRDSRRRDLLEVGFDYGLFLITDSLDVPRIAKHQLQKGNSRCRSN